MFVDDGTFSKLKAESVEKSFGAAQAGVVSARHLATMKIHALKHHQSHRHAKDYSDLVSLLRSGLTGISEEELQQLCERYADAALFTKLEQELAAE